MPVIERRRAGEGGELPIADNLIGYRLPDGSALSDTEAAVQMLGVFIGGTETVPKIVAHGLWELGLRPEQMTAVRSDLDANIPVVREEMIRYCAPAQWFARTLRKPFTIHGTTINPGQRIIRCWHRPAVTSASIRIPTSSSGTVASSACWRSVAGSISAWVCTWPA